MPTIKGIGFDLFGTLVLQERFNMEQSLETLFESLLASGLRLEKEGFTQAYRDVNSRLLAQAKQDGRETQNRLWIAGALRTLGHEVDSGDPRIEAAVDAYFDPFIDNCHLIPGTEELLEKLVGKYRLGLLSNFTHPPALYRILERLNIRRFFHVILISGSVGVRKPHPAIFGELTDRLGIPPEEIIYVGDELPTDIVGAHRVGMRTVWMSYRQKLGRSSPLENFLGLSEMAHQARPDHVIQGWSEFLAILP